MKYAFIERHRRVWPISVQCRVLRVSVAGYHEHIARKLSAEPGRYLADEALLVHIRATYAQSRFSYGWPRIWQALRANGVRVGKRRVQALMQQHRIRARGKRRFKVTTDSQHRLPIAENLLDRQFTVDAPNKVWVGDITYIPTDEGWLYLAVVIDLFARQVVGWSLRADMTQSLVIDALRMAWFRRRLSAAAGLLFHSDRGSQYASVAFNQLLKQYGIRASMSRRGDCWDNACSETLFGSLKVERLHGQRFRTRRKAKDEVIDWLLWCNHEQLHSTLAYLSPVRFKQNCTSQERQPMISAKGCVPRGQGQGKGRKDRLIPIGERALAWIDRYLHEVRPELLVDRADTTLFLTDHGQPFINNRMSDLVKGYLERCCITGRGVCHLFRRSMTTLMLDNGADLRFIQVMLGHAKIETTTIYTQVAIVKLREVYERTHPARMERNVQSTDGGAVE